MAAANSYLVIMAGGSGTRFWPKSTAKKPKQFLQFDASQLSLLQQTLQRFNGLVEADQRMIVTTEALRGLAQEQGEQAEILAEPAGRNTAPCVYWAAREIAQRDPQAVMLVMPSDHHIRDQEAYTAVLQKAMSRAAEGKELVTLGVKPTHAETGYGYLKTGASQGDALAVEGFFEKPDASTAQKYLDSGNYLWNAGMFLWRVDLILQHFDTHMPEMKKAWEAAQGDVAQAYPQMTATSIDFGIMEKVKDGIVTYPLDCGWNDLGNWLSMETLLGKNESGCTVVSGQIISIDSRDNIVDVPERLVALVGCKDLIVVEHGGNMLVCSKEHSQKIRQAVELIQKSFPQRA